MNIEEARNIIAKLDENFDSHDFIRLFIKHYPASYAQILNKHDNVNTAHGEIARFLNTNSVNLRIELVDKKALSHNIYNNVSLNAKWHKTI